MSNQEKVFKILGITERDSTCTLSHQVRRAVREFNLTNPDYCAVCTSLGYDADNIQSAIDAQDIETKVASYNNGNFTVTILRPEDWVYPVQEYLLQSQPLAYTKWFREKQNEE